MRRYHYLCFFLTCIMYYAVDGQQFVILLTRALNVTSASMYLVTAFQKSIPANGEQSQIAPYVVN